MGGADEEGLVVASSRWDLEDSSQDTAIGAQDEADQDHEASSQDYLQFVE